GGLFLHCVNHVGLKTDDRSLLCRLAMGFELTNQFRHDLGTALDFQVDLFPCWNNRQQFFQRWNLLSPEGETLPASDIQLTQLRQRAFGNQTVDPRSPFERFVMTHSNLPV